MTNNSKGFAHILTLIVTIVLFSVGGWWLWKNGKLNITVEGPTPTPTQTKTIEDIPDEWETYTDEIYKFTFRYPSGGEVKLDEGSNIEYVTVSYPGSDLRLEIKPNPKNPSFASRLEPIRTETINNITWKIYPESEYCDAGSCGKTVVTYQTEVNNVRYTLLPFRINDQTFNQILSTFQFIDERSPSVTSGEGG